ncbi:MAG: sigma 54-interacting transcriptional regulator [Acidobacteriota bacterium]|nr:sigma 54-interacting transcriptional regulator [Acidobacteriota bacterium]
MSSDRILCAEGSKQAGPPDLGWGGASAEPGDWALLGRSAANQQLRSQIQRIAPYFRVALISGELGSGKQAVGRAIHALSPRADGQFVAIDAAAMTDVLESGGAEAGCRSCVMEALEAARGGTLYVARVGELSFVQQGTLFDFLRGQEERRDLPGSGLRVLAESDRDLRALTSAGQFRLDLYGSLSVLEILVPPLRQRKEDIPVLAKFLLERMGREAGESPKMLGEAALMCLRRQAWPENLCGFERMLAQAARLTQGGVIEMCYLAALRWEEPAKAAAPAPAKAERLDDVIRRHVLEVLTQYGGNKLRAAKALGISRSTLYRMLEANSARLESRSVFG